MKLFFTLLFINLYALNIGAHPLHLSITNIDIYNDSILMAVKLFEDDFSDVLNNEGTANLDFSALNTETTTAIEAYFSKTLKISVNKVLTPYLLTNISHEGLALWIYFKMAINEEKTDLIAIESQLMLDWFSDQKNLVIVKYHEKEQGYQLDNKHRQLEFTVKK